MDQTSGQYCWLAGNEQSLSTVFSYGTQGNWQKFDSGRVGAQEQQHREGAAGRGLRHRKDCFTGKGQQHVEAVSAEARGRGRPPKILAVFPQACAEMISLPRGEQCCVYVEGFLRVGTISTRTYKYFSHFVFKLYKIHLNHTNRNSVKKITETRAQQLFCMTSHVKTIFGVYEKKYTSSVYKLRSSLMLYETM